MDRFSPRGRGNSERHRQLYKMTTPPWKETYRKRCLTRFRQSRERLVDMFRRFPGRDDEDVGNEIPQMMDQELDVLKREEVYDGNESFEELCALKDEIYNEILEEEQHLVYEYEASLCYGGDAATAAVPDTVLCPLCQKTMLRQSGNVIHCDCGLLIDTEQDCLTLSHLREQLKAGMDAHNSSCSVNAQFSQFNTVGISNLLITCSSCDFMFIVI